MLTINQNVQHQFSPLFKYPNFSEMSFSGGRSAAKSEEVAQWVVLKALERPRIILCAREIQKSLDESALPLLKAKIKEMNVGYHFKTANNRIMCSNGSVIIFKGLQEHLVEKTTKSLYNISILWVEEAQTISHTSLEIIIPTIREEGSQIVYTWNHRHKTDAIYERFYSDKKPPNSYAYQVYWWQNKFLSKTAVSRIDHKKLIDPEGYAHIYGGEFLKEQEGLYLFSYERLMDIYDFSQKIKSLGNFSSGDNCAGFDIADTGDDTNAWCLRSGSLIKDIQEWSKAAYIKESVMRVHDLNINHKVSTVCYDATGIGAGAKGDFAQLSSTYSAKPFLGAAKPRGADRDYLKRITNGQYFMNAKAQAWWNVRQRYERTLTYILDNEAEDKENLLLFDKTFKYAAAKKLIEELAQVQYNQDNKLRIDKAPNNVKSPNMADAVVLAFCNDISEKRGLRA